MTAKKRIPVVNDGVVRVRYPKSKVKDLQKLATKDRVRYSDFMRRIFDRELKAAIEE